MNVYYVGNNYDGCYYVRCLLPMQANGWSGDKMSLGSQPKDRQLSAREMLKHDVIVFQRPDEQVRVTVGAMLKKLGKKIVFENDDTYKIELLADDPMKFREGLRKRSKALDDFISQSDLVTTTTEFLADEYRKLNSNVKVLPNCVDPFEWDKPIRSREKKVRIGIVGSSASNGDFDGIKKTLDELNKMKDTVRLCLYALPVRNESTRHVQEKYKAEYEFWNQYNYTWWPFTLMEDYMDTLNSMELDIMLIPRKDSYFNRCKSNLKFLEASMLEIPVIAQAFSDGKSPYQQDIDGKNGILVEKDEDWLPAIMDLVENKEKRREMGKIAKQYVLDNYNIESKAHLWEEAYQEIYDN